MREILDEIHKLAANATDAKSLALSAPGGRGRAVSERIGQILVDLMLPSVEVVADLEERGVVNLEVVKLGFLLAVYRAETGKYPARLSDLAPKYTAEVPLDPSRRQ